MSRLVFIALLLVPALAFATGPSHAPDSLAQVNDEPFDFCEYPGPPNCTLVTSTLYFCSDPCGQMYWQSTSVPPCDALACWAFYDLFDGYYAIQHIPCPYAVGCGGRGELEKPERPRRSTWDGVKKLYRD